MADRQVVLTATPITMNGQELFKMELDGKVEGVTQRDMVTRTLAAGRQAIAHKSYIEWLVKEHNRINPQDQLQLIFLVKGKLYQGDPIEWTGKGVYVLDEEGEKRAWNRVYDIGEVELALICGQKMRYVHQGEAVDERAV